MDSPAQAEELLTKMKEASGCGDWEERQKAASKLWSGSYGGLDKNHVPSDLHELFNLLWDQKPEAKKAVEELPAQVGGDAKKQLLELLLDCAVLRYHIEAGVESEAGDINWAYESLEKAETKEKFIHGIFHPK